MSVTDVEAPPQSTRAWKKNPGSQVVLPFGVKARWILGVFLVCLVYAIVRYNVFKGVEWIHLPLYVVNKAFAWGGLALIACSYLTGKWINAYPDDVQKRRALAKFLGLSGLYLIGMHLISSLAMLTPEYYAKFFTDGGKMNLTGEFVILFGVLGIGFLMFPAITTLPLMYEALGGERWQRAQRMGYWTLGMAALHTATMGWKGWIDVATWPGGMPPITLLGFLTAAAGLVAKLTSKR